MHLQEKKKNEKELENQIRIIKIYSQHTEMEFVRKNVP